MSASYSSTNNTQLKLQNNSLLFKVFSFLILKIYDKSHSVTLRNDTGLPFILGPEFIFNALNSTTSACCAVKFTL